MKLHSVFVICFVLASLVAADVTFPVAIRGVCGPFARFRCANNLCCNTYGICGNSTADCGSSCMHAWGACRISATPSPNTLSNTPTPSNTPSNTGTNLPPELRSSTSTPQAPSTTATMYPVTEDRFCGERNKKRCPDPQCCNRNGFCGTTSSDCGDGCQWYFGRCSGMPTQTAPGTPTATLTPRVRPSRVAPSQSSMPYAIYEPCGPQAWKRCPENLCCSKHNYCGTGTNFCGDGCQPAYGYCPNYPTPTSAGFPGYHMIQHCTKPGTVALIFDGGPTTLTQRIMELVESEDGKATFFISGQNSQCIFDRTGLLQDLINRGHQIGSQSWFYQDLTKISDATAEAHLIRLETALQKITGAIPAYWKPPFGKVSQPLNEMAYMNRLNYLVIPSISPANKDDINAFMSSSTSRNHIVGLWETMPGLTEELLPFVMDWARSRGLRMVTVGECMGEQTGLWYKTMGSPGQHDRTWICNWQEEPTAR